LNIFETVATAYRFARARPSDRARVDGDDRRSARASNCRARSPGDEARLTSDDSRTKARRWGVSTPAARANAREARRFKTPTNGAEVRTMTNDEKNMQRR